jgi:hypothetical protein
VLIGASRVSNSGRGPPVKPMKKTLVTVSVQVDKT